MRASRQLTRGWFFEHVLSEKQLVAFLLLAGTIVFLQNLFVDDYRYDQSSDKGTYLLSALGLRIPISAFVRSFDYLVAVQVAAVFLSLKWKSHLALLLVIVVPLLWRLLVIVE
jgi:hypothetical protein